MRLAIMQPYFFPYLGYFQLLLNCDLFIYFDVVKYNKRSWTSRNRILNSNEFNETQYINIPIVKCDFNTLIKDALINDSISWKSKIIGQLTGYKLLKAPYYNNVRNLIEDAFLFQTNNLTEFNIAMINHITEYLGIDYAYEQASLMNLSTIETKQPGDWALSISSKLNANEYINPYSGFKIFDESAFHEKEIRLSFLKPKLSPYPQNNGASFAEALSILDVLMFNSKQEIIDMLYNDFLIMDQSSVGDFIRSGV